MQQQTTPVLQSVRTLVWRLRRDLRLAYLPVSGFACWLVGRDELRHAPPPVLIGGTGGSGTRVVAQVVAAGGYWIGHRVNHAFDAIEIIDRYSEYWSRHNSIYAMPFAPVVRQRMNRDLAVALIAHRRSIPHPQAPWAAKNPRLIVLLPHLHSCLPAMRFIHVVRDGRDHAFATTQYQLDAIGPTYLPALTGALAGTPRPVQAAALWSRVNLDAAAFAAHALGQRYLRVRLEDLCAQPAETVAQIFRFIAAPSPDLDAALRVITPPASLGRWRTRPAQLCAAITRVAAAGLDAFGYAR